VATTGGGSMSSLSAKKVLRRARALAYLVALTCAASAGCGNDSGSLAGTPGTTTASGPVAEPRGGGRSDEAQDHRSQRPVNNQSASGGGPEGSGSSASQPKPITLPNGTIYTPPPIPSVTESAPGHKCIPVEQGSPAPPKPGIRSARITHGTFTLAYYFHALPAECTPEYLRVGVDDSRSYLPAGGDTFRIAGDRGEVNWPVPDDLRSADIAVAIAIGPDGISSEAAQVRIR
jgi:hypothetical protein